MRRISTLVLLALFSACETTPSGSLEEAAAQILTRLDEGERDSADQLFSKYAKDDTTRQQLYPLLYEAGQERYETGDFGGAALPLGFLADHYPDAVAVREARLYALFLARSMVRGSDPELTKEIEEALTDLRTKSTTPPAWIDLVETQQAIDQARLDDARQYLERFHLRWDGTPEALAVYVDDLDRYLASH